MRVRLGLAALVLAGMATSALARDDVSPTGAPPQPQGEPSFSGFVEDRDFGVRTSQFGLDRRVEMFQWQRDGDDRYEQVWKPALVDASGFAPGHDNPLSFPLESRRWWATDVTLDGKPLDLAVLKALGQWQDFRPGFTRLPANLAATFQPEGDGLGSSINPLDPKIGDLRIHWRELHLPPLAGHVELRDGRWQLSARTEKAVLNARPLPSVAQDVQVSERSLGPWTLGGALVLVAVIGLSLFGRRRRKR
ncbi:MAG TPA: TMEM43 family protein [Lysobacter sp.]|nr:TMEM43 family protein [Lysobacter sp.]